MKPVWHDDVFACYAPMIKRLNQLVIDGVVKIIKEADDIDDLVGDNPNTRPLDNALYVIFDSLTPAKSNKNGQEQEEVIGFSLVYVTKKYNFRGLSGTSVGQVLASIAKLMNGFLPYDDDGRACTLSPFVQDRPLPIMYKNGFGYFSKRYTTTVATCAT